MGETAKESPGARPWDALARIDAQIADGEWLISEQQAAVEGLRRRGRDVAADERDLRVLGAVLQVLYERRAALVEEIGAALGD